MELGVLGLDGFQCSENASTRSVGIKQEGSGFCAGDWRFSKVAKTDGDYSPSSASTALFLQNNRIPPFKSLSSDANMLSFSSCSKSDTSTFPYFQQMAGVIPKNTGYYSGALNTSAGMFVLNGVRGPFTQSQWYELEQQALIYKYLTANEPIPAYLLIPIKKALESAGLFGLNGGTLRPPPWGWSPFFGYSNSTDPEPGRCRRTDGKKWRCSKDAMPDQKYCERHMNRGRHRSRKLVEGQGNAATKSTATKLTPPPPLVTPRGGLADNLTQHYHQSNSLQHSTSNPAVNSLLNRMVVNQENSGQGMQDTSQLSFLSLSGSNINSRDFTFPIPKHENSNKESAPARSTYEVPSDGSSSILWPGLETTELSMSTNDKAAFLPLRVPQQLEMGLSVGAESHNSMNFSWKPSSWEPSMGGPLGEALQSSSSNNIHEDSKNTSALNLLPMGWDKMGSYQLSSSSPTGVLQRSSLVSLSNSSAGSSPRAETSKTIESVGSFCNDQLGSTTLAHSTSMPASD